MFIVLLRETRQHHVLSKNKEALINAKTNINARSVAKLDVDFTISFVIATGTPLWYRTLLWYRLLKHDKLGFQWCTVKESKGKLLSESISLLGKFSSGDKWHMVITVE